MVLSDIHGNFSALKAVIQNYNLSKNDIIIFLGDIFSFGPSPKEIGQFILSNPNLIIIIGNHDYHLIHKNYENMGNCSFCNTNIDNKQVMQCEAWVAEELKETWKLIKDRFKFYYILKDKQVNKTFLFTHSLFYDCHADPSLLNEAYIKEIKSEFNCNVHISGHSHSPSFFNKNKVTFLNPGSVGLPFDSNDEASFLIITIENNEWSYNFIKKKYNKNKTIRLLKIKQPPLWKRTEKWLLLSTPC